MNVKFRRLYRMDDKEDLKKDITDFIDENWERLCRGEPYYNKIIAELELDS